MECHSGQFLTRLIRVRIIAVKHVAAIVAKALRRKMEFATRELAARRIDRATLNHVRRTRWTRGALLPARALPSAYFRRLESRYDLAFLFRRRGAPTRCGDLSAILRHASPFISLKWKSSVKNTEGACPPLANFENIIETMSKSSENLSEGRGRDRINPTVIRFPRGDQRRGLPPSLTGTKRAAAFPSSFVTKV